MSLGSLLSAPPPISWHAFAAIAALAVGGAQLALPKGTIRHRVLGYAWVALILGHRRFELLDPADPACRSVQPDPSAVDPGAGHGTAGGLVCAHA
jgi:hypothetical protein